MRKQLSILLLGFLTLALGIGTIYITYAYTQSNTSPSDSSADTLECGNGALDTLTEQCDDSNTISGDGCDSQCKFEVDITPTCTSNLPTALISWQSSLDLQLLPLLEVSSTADFQTPWWNKMIFTDIFSTIAPDGFIRNDGNGPDLTFTDNSTYYIRLIYLTPTGRQIARIFAINNNYCTGETPGPICGNGTVESGEQCDDGNTNNNDSCSNNCTLITPQSGPICGNGTVESGEQCDDGNTSNNDTCSSTCTIITPQSGAVCGNGTVEVGEQCDDGNTNNNDSCSNACTILALPNTALSGSRSKYFIHGLFLILVGIFIYISKVGSNFVNSFILYIFFPAISTNNKFKKSVLKNLYKKTVKRD